MPRCECIRWEAIHHNAIYEERKFWRLPSATSEQWLTANCAYIQYPCIHLGSMWQSAATWHFPWHHSFPARFKLCTETWKQYIPMRNRAILLYLILNGLLFQLNVLTEVRVKSVLWFWSFSCESLCLARQNGGVIVGSHNWMATEWLQGVHWRSHLTFIHLEWSCARSVLVCT